MGTLAFAKDFKMLESKELHPIFKFLHESMLSVVIFGHAMWFLTFLNNIPGLASPMKRLNAWADQQIEDQISVRQILCKEDLNSELTMALGQA